MAQDFVVNPDVKNICHILRQYISGLSVEKRPLFLAYVNHALSEGLKAPPAPPMMPFAGPTVEDLGTGHRQRHFGVGIFDDSPSPFDVGPSDSPSEPPTDNIAFRTIPCRNWIKFKGNCRLGSKCRLWVVLFSGKFYCVF